jgi:hypothetical protein
MSRRLPTTPRKPLKNEHINSIKVKVRIKDEIIKLKLLIK